MWFFIRRRLPWATSGAGPRVPRGWEQKSLSVISVLCWSKPISRLAQIKEVVKYKLHLLRETSISHISKEAAYLRFSLEIVYHWAAGRILCVGHPDWILGVHWQSRCNSSLLLPFFPTSNFFFRDAQVFHEFLWHCSCTTLVVLCIFLGSLCK